MGDKCGSKDREAKVWASSSLHGRNTACLLHPHPPPPAPPSSPSLLLQLFPSPSLQLFPSPSCSSHCLQVLFNCSTLTQLHNVSETSTCKYSIWMDTPLACFKGAMQGMCCPISRPVDLVRAYYSACYVESDSHWTRIIVLCGQDSRILCFLLSMLACRHLTASIDNMYLKTAVQLLSLVPRPTPFFTLRFALTIIHGSRRAALPHLLGLLGGQVVKALDCKHRGSRYLLGSGDFS